MALENFDATGMWRDRDRYAGAAIDASGELPDGTPIKGPDDLRKALLRRPEQFVQTFTEGLLTYATGRKLEHLRHADRAPDRARRGERATTGFRRWSRPSLGANSSECAGCRSRRRRGSDGSDVDAGDRQQR